jgi:hypothetical protein
MSSPVWQQPEIIRWSQILTANFRQLLGKDLIDPVQSPEQLAQNLFHAPLVVVSHGTQADPIFNYGNKTALELWSTSWIDLIKTPSRLTAEPVNRDTRAAMLEQANKLGYIDNYQGIRISSTGQRFVINQAIIWNLSEESGLKCGQAATFADWKWLE